MFSVLDDSDLSAGATSNQCLGLRELFRDEIKDLGESSPDWWREDITPDENKPDGSQSPIFKTPQLSLKSKRCRRSFISSCGIKRIASPIEECSMEFYSPFKCSRLSPIPSAVPDNGTVPPSLEPLLHDGSEVSWSSAFATPLTTNVSWSNLNSEEKKLLMPSSSSKNPRVLFTSDSRPEETELFHSFDTNEELHQKDSIILFEDSNEIYDSVPDNEENICDKTFVVHTGKKCDVKLLEGNNQEFVKEKVEKPYNEVDFSLVRIRESNQLNNTSASDNEENICAGKPQRQSLLASPDSGMNEITLNNVEFSPVASVGNSVVSRKLFDKDCQDSAAKAQVEEDSGAGGSRDASRSKLSTSLNAQDCNRSHPAPFVEELKDITPSNENVFKNDFSFNTLEEIRQVTELLATTADSPIECPDDTITPRHFQVSRISRTSTPIVHVSKHSKLNETKRKRIAFVQPSDNESDHRKENCTGKVKSTMPGEERTTKNFPKYCKNNNEVLKKRAPVTVNSSESRTDTNNFSSRVQTIKNAQETKKFTYTLLYTNKETITGQERCTKIKVKDVIESAQALESVVETKSGRSTKQIKNSGLDQSVGLVPFCELQNVSEPFNPEEVANEITVGTFCNSLNYSDRLEVKDYSSENINSDIQYENRLERSLPFESLCEDQNLSKHMNLQKSGIDNFDSSADKIMETASGKQDRKLIEEKFSSPSCNKNDKTVIRTFDSKIVQNKFCTNNSSHEFKTPKCSNPEIEMYGNISDDFTSADDKSLKNTEVYSLMELKSGHDSMLSDSQMVVVAEHAELLHHLTNEGSRFTQWSGEAESNKMLHNDLTVEVTRDADKRFSVIDRDQKLSSAIQMCTPYNMEVLEADKTLQNVIENKKPNKLLYSKLKNDRTEKTSTKKEDDNLDEILNSTVVRQLFNEGSEKNFSEHLSEFSPYNIDTVSERNLGNSTKQSSHVNSHDNSSGIIKFRSIPKKVSSSSIVKDCDNIPYVMKLDKGNSSLSKPTEEIYNHIQHDSENIAVKRNPLFGQEGSLWSASKQDVNLADYELPKENILQEQFHNSKALDVTANVKRENIPIFQGFAAASGRKLSVSEKALDQAKAMFSEEALFVESSAVFEDLSMSELLNLDKNNKHSTSKKISKSGNRLPDAFPDENDMNTANHNLDFTADEINKGFEMSCKFSDSKIEETTKKSTYNRNAKEREKSRILHKSINKPPHAVSHGTSDVEDRLCDNVLANTVGHDNLTSNKNINKNKPIHNKKRFSLHETFTTELGPVNMIDPKDSVFKEMKENSNVNESASHRKTTTNIHDIEDIQDEIIPMLKETTNETNILHTEEAKMTDDAIGFRTPYNGFSSACGKQSVAPDNALILARAMLDLDSTGKTSITSHFQGFETASGKNVAVSEGALKKARSLFNEETTDINTPVKIPDKADFQAFTTAGGKNIGLSKESLKKARMLFNEEITDMNIHVKSTGVENFQGFATASGKNVSVSEESLKEARTLFNEETSDTNTHVKPLSIADFQGFATASGKNVAVSEASLKKARLLFSEDAIYMDSPKKPPRVKNLQGIPTGSEGEMVKDSPVKSPTIANLHGFSTANGKNVAVSEESLKKARTLFAEETDTASLVKPLIVADFQGFATASGKNIAISKESLEKAKTLFSEERTEIECHIDIGSPAKPPEETAFQGFATTNGKNIAVSKESLEKAKTLFSEERTEIECPIDIDSPVKPPEETAFQGFATASGKNIAVSKESLEKMKTLFSEETTKIDCPQDTLNFQGFATGSGKKIGVSEESLKKARKLFAEETKDVNTPIQHPGAANFQGFSTASGKLVDVSEESLKKARTLFSEETTEFDCPMSPQGTLKFQGFATASGKKVPVSEDSVKAARTLFAEETRNEHPPGVAACFQGFATASGKHVDMSEESLKKARTLFSEETTEFDCPVSPQGFATASGKKVSVPEESVKKARALFTEETRDAQPPSAANFQGFATASGKHVAVSEESLKKARTLFSEETTEFDCPMSPQGTLKFQGFATASGKKVPVSEDSVKAARTLFAEETRNEHPPGVAACFQGFATASGKHVDVSEESLKKARTLFSEETTEFDCPVSPQGFATASGKKVSVPEESVKKAGALFTEETRDAQPPSAANFQGFATASGKHVAVSEESLKKARTLFSEETTEFDCPMSPQGTLKFQGFATASGKRVPVSENSVNAARTLFAEETRDEHPPGVAACFQGFATASGKNVAVSEKSLKKVRTLLSEEMEELDFPIRPPGSSDFEGFATAGGKKVAVSEESLKNARTILNKENAMDSPFRPPPTAHFQGFETAGGRHVTVSEEALNRSKQLFPENTIETESRESLSSITSSHQAFSVARDKTSNEDQCVPEKKKINVPILKAKYISDGPSIASGTDEDESDTLSFPVSPVLQSSLSTKSARTSSSKDKRNRKRLSISSRRKSMNESNSVVRSSACKEKSLVQNQCEANSDKNEDLSKYLKADIMIETDTRDLKRNEHVESNKKDVSKREVNNINIQNLGYEASDENRTSVTKAVVKYLKRNEQRVERDSKVASRREDLNIQSLGYEVFDEYKTSLSKSDVKYLNRNEQYIETESKDALVGEGNNISIRGCKDGVSNEPKTMNLTQEIKECAAALLADVEDTFESYISCPDMVHDSLSARPAMLSSEENITEGKKTEMPGSPVLSRQDWSKRKRRSKFSQSSTLDGCSQSTQVPSSSTFKVPYKTSVKTEESSTPTLTSKGQGRFLDFSTPFAKRLRFNEPEVNIPDSTLIEKEVSVQVTAGRLAAAAAQDALIKQMSSSETRRRPCKGSHYQRKLDRSLQKSWQQIVGGEGPKQYTRSKLLTFGVKESTINVTAENAADFVFSAWNYYSTSVCRGNVSGVLVGDGARLVLDEKGNAGLREVTCAFLSSPGVEPNLVPAGWVANHYRWLVWKLASTERSFPQHFAGRCLTPNMLLLQLKYRYDREIDDCQRPAIRKILEHDDSAAKRLILCVANIFKVGKTEGDGSQYELELTDGWYGVRAGVDQELCHRIRRGTITVGTKLVSHGAELVNCEQGCSPLEVGSDVRLKLCSNSTRRARWDAKLGFCSRPGPIPVSLTSVLPSGGLVSCVQVTVVRMYPMMYVEKLEGRSVVRSQRAEERAAALWEKSQQDCVEQVYSQVKREMSQEDAVSIRQHIPGVRELELIFSGDRLSRIMQLASDPASIEAMLTEEQKIAVANYHREKAEKLQQEVVVRVQSKLKEMSKSARNVTPLLKVRCVDPSVPMSTKSAVISIWRPPEDISQLLKEGNTVKIFSVHAAGIRSGDLQLSAGRYTAYKPCPQVQCQFHERRVTNLSEAMCPDFQPPFGELDTVGVVVHISSAPQGTSGFQTVYLADASHNVLGIAFWSGIKPFCWEMLKPRILVAASNLQWRHGAAVRWVPCAYASELSMFSSHPRQPYLQEALSSLAQQIDNQDLESFYFTCEEKVSKLLKGIHSEPVSRSSPNTRGKLNSPNCVTPKARTPVLSGPLDELFVINRFEFGESPLDRRLYELRQYGDPPPLPFEAISVTPTVKKEFRLPKRLASPAASPPLSLDSDPD